MFNFVNLGELDHIMIITAAETMAIPYSTAYKIEVTILSI